MTMRRDADHCEAPSARRSRDLSLSPKLRRLDFCEILPGRGGQTEPSPPLFAHTVIAELENRIRPGRAQPLQFAAHPFSSGAACMRRIFGLSVVVLFAFSLSADDRHLDPKAAAVKYRV